MEEKKLTDEKIVKALEICTTEKCEEFDCGILEDCPLRNEKYCVRKLTKNALDLINRLQSENESLKKDYIELDLECRELRTELDKELAEHEEFTQTAKAEIERLTQRLELADKDNDNLAQTIFDYEKQVDELKKNGKICKEITEGKE